MTLLDRRLVHFIASDGHDLKHRPPTMNEAHGWLVKNYGQGMADALCIDNPRATLSGQCGEFAVYGSGEPAEEVVSDLAVRDAHLVQIRNPTLLPCSFPSTFNSDSLLLHPTCADTV